MNEALAETMSPELASQKIQWLRESIGKVVVGQTEVIDQVIIALLSRGHVLIEGVPGLGKTLLVKTLANCISCSFKRIQFTPDLMPSDVTGHAMYSMKDGTFSIRKGPIFTNLLLADEINRAPAKTQAALLEVMQENQVTIEGEAYQIQPPFMVLATQNPIEQDGTYPLPEAELDRFLLKIFIDYPNLEREKELVSKVATGKISMVEKSLLQDVQIDSLELEKLQAFVNAVTLDEQVLDYAVRLVQSTRTNSAILKGAGPRASIGVVVAAKAIAAMNGRNFVLPDDVKAVVKPVLRHRILLAPDTEVEGLSSDDVLGQTLQLVDAPRS